MKIIVNGKEENINDKSTITDLLNNFKIKKEAIVVEINLSIPDTNDYDSIILNPDDKVELIQFMGGG